jgi:hypothetical protein
LLFIILFEHRAAMRAGVVVFGDKAIADLTSKHLFLRTADHVDFTVFGSTKHHADVHLVPLQCDFCGDGVLEGFGQSIRPVEHTAVVHIGHGHGHFTPFAFATRRFDRNASLPGNAAHGDFGQPLEEGVVQTAVMLSTDGAGQHGCGRIWCTLALQTAHVSSKRGKHVTCR